LNGNNGDDCEKQLAAMLLAIEAVRIRPTEFKGLAQRFRQLGNRLPPDVRRGYVEQIQNQQRNLQQKIEKYIESGCGDPPPLIYEWAFKEIPAAPKSPEAPPKQERRQLPDGPVLAPPPGGLGGLRFPIILP